MQSLAGRDFCYNDVIWPEDKFRQCSYAKNNVLSAITCCDNMGQKDQSLSLAYDCKVETIGKAALVDHLESLESVLYPACGVISYKPNRVKCCDEAVKSAAGRSYCYNDVIHARGKFDRCLKDTSSDKIACCEASYRN